MRSLRPHRPLRPLRRAISLAATLLFTIAFALIARPLHAGGLTDDERAALGRGEVVARPLAFALDDGRYVGGVSYVIIRAPVRDIMDALEDVSTYPNLLPLLAEARLVRSRGDESVVKLTHYTRFAKASYTLRVRRDAPTLVRFWLDRAYPADLEDCWGFFRVTRINKDTSLLTYATLMNLGFGVARFLFESKIQGYALSTPGLVRRYIEDKRNHASLLNAAP